MAKKKNKTTAVTVGFIALGCPKNVVDSERMLAEITQSGLLITAEPEQADVVVINTCGFIAPAKAEALEAIRQAADWKSKPAAVKKVIVAGCLAERLGSDLFKQVQGIDAIVGLGQRDDIAEIIKKTIHSHKPKAYLAHSCRSVSDDKTRLLITSRHWAYLRISEGCSHKCSFCTIPAIRGPLRSKPINVVCEEAAELAAAGVVELNLIAQDTASYGRDLKMKNGLAELLSLLEKIPGIEWLRLMYSYPTEINQQLIEAIAAGSKILNYLDMPIQHINNKILHDMRRPDTKEKIVELIEKLRGGIADIVLRTTVIVGFPGETDREFAELLDFINWAQFDALGAFVYYAESGTAAAEMPNQVLEDVKQNRLEELMLAQQRIAFAKNKARIGTELTCLINSVDSDGTASARFFGQAPEIDSVCLIRNCSAKPGRFIRVRVVDTADYDLVVKQI
ncbi:MAG: 30S ribosomal protein S12 methylthiotransferase RimO [Planctomycetota bacterium]